MESLLSGQSIIFHDNFDVFSQNVWKNMWKLDVLFLDYFCKFFLFLRRVNGFTSFLTLILNFLNVFSNKGYRFMVFNNNTSQPSQTSFFESPLYERSYEGHNICVRFRYLIYGPGRHFLRIYQQLNLTDYPRRLMWAVNESNNTDLIWKYGRVALPSVTKYKVRKNRSPHNLFVVFSQGTS